MQATENVALDTDRLTDLFRGDSELAEGLGMCDRVSLPFVVLGEIKAGFYGGSRQRRNEALLHRFLSKSNVTLLFPDAETIEQYGRLFVQLKQAVTPIPDNDLWIAALVLQHNLILITRDNHFGCIPQLRLG